MFSKKPDAYSPLKFKPLICLPTIHKLLTSVIADEVYIHCEQNNILMEKLKGCCQNSRGCKDPVTFDNIAVLHAKEHQRNLHMAYINYKQSFISVPHDYLNETLKAYKICPCMIRSLGHAMPF